MAARPYLLMILLLTISPFKNFGTGQVPDILIFNGDTSSISSTPLEAFPTMDSLQKRLFGGKEGCFSTACWRRYQAEWTILNNQLYLTNIFSCCFHENRIKADLKTLFGEKCENGKVKASWVTENLITPKGKFLFYSPSDYYSVYEGQTVLVFEKGALIETKNYDNSKSRQSEYSKDNKKLLEHIYTQIAWNQLPKQDRTINVFIQFSANEQGVVDSVKVIKGHDVLFDSEAISAVRTIPEWDVVYKLGQHQRRTWNLPIVFSEENRQKYKKN
ncbi:hypothetical protein HNQ92_000803 [Rhabdobacter roseus]|uniref:TonB C-terminal domain-containing protein n=1 Tax=Rhabdobacter roseus TaxID=1655419 RepID=A0A840TMA3_9BACT|nr:energy transducer TonB [Rhabdobacter roseus]MBB5282682.1 hypothetical protein [Rhabdobacter roseus]